ncbi:MAG: Hpt domain-containing protein [Deltaproteobacteria bacterium]|nr:Hpt domain-containing protein [Deltaproteobacteria bacterium]
MDPAKYRALFLEEATEHLAEMSRALLELEKDPRAREAIDLVFRMVHSLKGMGASLGYEAVSELSHRLEDRLGAWRARGGIDDPAGLPLLFRGLESLEGMVAAVRETGGAPQPDPALVAALDAHAPEPAPAGEAPAAGALVPKKTPARAR